MKIVLFVLSNFFVFAAAAIISDMMFAKRGRGFRFLALLCFAAVEIIWIELAAGFAGKLTFPIVNFMAGGVFVLTAAVWLAVNRGQLSQKIFSRRILLVPVFLIMGLGLGWLAGQYGFQGTHFCEDDLNYHASAVAHWYLAKDISAGTYNYHAYKPLNAELFSLWFLLPFGQDGLVFLAGLFWMILTCTAAIVLMQTLAIDRKWYGPIIFAIFCTDIILYQATWTFSAVDLAGPAMVLAALAFLASASQSRQVKRWPYILLTGLCAGFACGTKVPFVTVVLVLLVWIFFAFKDRFEMRVGNVFLFGCGVILTGGFWYIRNLILTGNPVFPGQLGPFDGPLTREIQFSSSLAGHIIKSGFDTAAILEIFQRHLAWPVGMFILAAAGWIAGVFFWRNKNEYRKIIGLLLLVTAVMLITYPVMPFSGQNDSPDGHLAIALRFVIGPILLGLILFSLPLNRRPILWFWFYLLLVVQAFAAIPNAIKALTAVAAVAGLIFFHFYRRPVPHVFSCLTAVVVMTGGLLGLAVAFPVQQAKTDRRLFTDRLITLNLGGVWQKIDTLPVGSKVAAFGPLAYCYYPHFGRHFQLCPRPLLAGLKPYQPLHIQWKNDPAHIIWRPKVDMADPKAWMEGLIQSGAEYILVQRSSDGLWPQPDEILRRFDNAEKIDSGDNWILWKIKR